MIPTKHSLGWRLCTLSQSNPRRCKAEGRNEASNKSAVASNSSNFARPSGDLRSIRNTVCPWHSDSYQPGAAVLVASPVGGSTLVTSAPSFVRRAAATGPGAFSARLTIFTPCSSVESSGESIWLSFLTQFEGLLITAFAAAGVGNGADLAGHWIDCNIHQFAAAELQ